MGRFSAVRCGAVQHTKECLAKIGIQAEGHDGEHGQDAIFKLIAAIMHLLNVGFKSGEDSSSSFDSTNGILDWIEGSRDGSR